MELELTCGSSSICVCRCGLDICFIVDPKIELPLGRPRGSTSIVFFTASWLRYAINEGCTSGSPKLNPAPIIGDVPALEMVRGVLLKVGEDEVVRRWPLSFRSSILSCPPNIARSSSKSSVNAAATGATCNSECFSYIWTAFSLSLSRMPCDVYSHQCKNPVTIGLLDLPKLLSPSETVPLSFQRASRPC